MRTDPIVVTIGPRGATGARREETQVHAAEQDIMIELDLGDIVTRGEEWGGQLVRHLVLPPATDLTPLFVGLPGDRCECPHWGYVLEGSITVRYADGTEETSRAGDVYFWPGGHVGWTDEGVTFVEFSPADTLRPVLEHLAAKLTPSA